jgi:hypothetical protein
LIVTLRFEQKGDAMIAVNPNCFVSQHRNVSVIDSHTRLPKVRKQSEAEFETQLVSTSAEMIRKQLEFFRQKTTMTHTTLSFPSKYD